MIIDEMGYFWWDNLMDSPPIVPGHLTVDEMGRVSLEMHGSLGGELEFDALFGQIPLKEKRIRGELKKSGKKILLTQITTKGASVGRFTYVKYSSQVCYASHSEIEHDNFFGLLFPLAGLEGWFKPGNAEHNSPTNDRFDLSLSLSPGKTWGLDSGVLTLTTGFERDIFSVNSSTVSISMKARFEYLHNEVTSAEELLKWSNDFNDFISLLTNSSYVPRRPSIIWRAGEVMHSAECYYYQSNTSERSINWCDVTLPLLRIKNDFGRLLQAWFDKKRSLGPGINLYLGAIKNQHLFAENRFVNMIWGLESLDRRSVSTSEVDASCKLMQKSKRIHQLIIDAKILKSDDKRWLGNILNRSHERSLAERLFDVLSPVAAGFDIAPPLLRLFCKECADLRNDMSHHGGERSPGEYDSFINKLIPRMHVLEKLYPLVIFDLIKVENAQMLWIMHGNHNSFQLKMYLKRAGLLTDAQFKDS